MEYQTSLSTWSQPPMSIGSSPSHPSRSAENLAMNQPTKSRRLPPSYQHPKILSCAECRRSKLRCDRQFPCESCRKRGLEHLCPNKALTTRPKTFQSDADHLRQENLRLQERIRQLEGALVLLDRFSQGAHPGITSQSDLAHMGWDMSSVSGRSASAP